MMAAPAPRTKIEIKIGMNIKTGGSLSPRLLVYLVSGAFSTNFGVSNPGFEAAGRTPETAVVHGLRHILSRVIHPLPHGFERSGLQYAVGLACAIDVTNRDARTRDLSILCSYVSDSSVSAIRLKINFRLKNAVKMIASGANVTRQKSLASPGPLYAVMNSASRGRTIGADTEMIKSSLIL